MAHARAKLAVPRRRRLVDQVPEDGLKPDDGWGRWASHARSLNVAAALRIGARRQADRSVLEARHTNRRRGQYRAGEGGVYFEQITYAVTGPTVA